VPMYVGMNLVLVDDHAAYRQSFRIALSSLTGYQVVAEASSARAGCRVIQANKPDLAVVDFILGDSDGISLVRELRRQRVRTPVLLLGRSPHPIFLRDAFKAGVRGFALKTEPLARLIEAIGVVGDGKRYISPQLEPYLESTAAPDEGLERLSRREREVLCLLMEGQSSKEIARSLCISVRTADAHRLHINRKLGVRSPSELTHLLAGQGMIAG
jgi:two-component system, NarL family, nitrate/nitrite response regulator NarL